MIYHKVDDVINSSQPKKVYFIVLKEAETSAIA